MTRFEIDFSGKPPRSASFVLRFVPVDAGSREAGWLDIPALAERRISAREGLELRLPRMPAGRTMAALLLSRDAAGREVLLDHLVIEDVSRLPEVHTFSVNVALLGSRPTPDDEDEAEEPRRLQLAMPGRPSRALSDRLLGSAETSDQLASSLSPALSERVNRKISKRREGRDRIRSRLKRPGAEDRIPAGAEGERRRADLDQARFDLSSAQLLNRGLRAPENAPLLERPPTSTGTFLGEIPGVEASGRAVRQPGPVEKLRRRKEAKAFARESAKTASASLDRDDPKSDTREKASLESLIASILGSTVFSQELGARANADDIRESLSQTLAAGPADQTAYFDHDTLHIAWKDTWTSALSDQTTHEVAELYSQIVKLVDYTAPKTSENAEVDALNDLLAELSGVVGMIAEDAGSPAEIANWLGRDISKVWTSIGLVEQRQLFDLYDLHYHAVVYLPAGEDGFIVREGQTRKEASALRATVDPIIEMYVPGRVSVNFPEDPETQIGTLTIDIASDTATRVKDTAYAQGLPEDVQTQTLYQVAVYERAKRVANAIIDAAETAVEEGTVSSPLGRAEQLITKLQERADEPYSFDVFTPNSVNYGLITRFRQKWQPIAYQAGDLAGTLPLAPGEKRTFSTKRTRSTTLKSTTSSSSLTSLKNDFSSQLRSEAEIARKVDQSLKSGATVNSDSTVSGNVGFLGNGVTGSSTLAFGGSLNSDVGSNSSTTKKDIADTTRKMAQEFKDENKVEVTTETTSTFESTSTREISNRNQELSVTYLFYELQRRFEVSSRLNEIIPVILVAFEMPNPDEIHETWILQYEHVIRRSLLDLKFLPVLEHLRSDFTGDEVAVEIEEAQWKTQMSIVAELKQQMGVHTDLRDAARDAVLAASQQVLPAGGSGGRAPGAGIGDNLGEAVEYAALGLTTGVGGVLAKALFDRDRNDEDGAAAPDLSGEDLGAERDSARRALDWADLDRAQAEGALREGIGALERATEKYVAAIRRRLDRRTGVDQLILHIKTNIIHYCQAVWRAEQPDQRYLRLYDVKVPWGDETITFRRRRNLPLTDKVQLENFQNLLPGEIAGVQEKREFFLLGTEESSTSETDDGDTTHIERTLLNRRPLHEVADLDQLLGFRGNYGVFRLRESNLITMHMVQEFLDTELGLIDPDADGNLLTAQEALELAAAAWEEADGNATRERAISQELLAALEAAQRVSQHITVPTGELFIEALPGSHPVLEDFKLTHRAADAHRATVDAKFSELELIRRAQRLLDGNASDPDVDKIVQVQGIDASVKVDGD